MVATFDSKYDDIDYLSRKADIQMKYHHFLNPMTYNKNLYFRNRTEACLNSKDLYRSYKRVENTFSIDTSSQSRYWSLSPKHRDVLYILSYMFVYVSASSHLHTYSFPPTQEMSFLYKFTLVLNGITPSKIDPESSSEPIWIA